MTHNGLNNGLTVRSLRRHESCRSHILVKLLLPILGLPTEKLHFLSLQCCEQGSFACSRGSNNNENIFILQIHFVNVVEQEFNGLIQNLNPLAHREILLGVLLQLFISLLCVPALAVKHRQLLPINHNILPKLQRIQHAYRHLILFVTPFHELGDRVGWLRQALIG